MMQVQKPVEVIFLIGDVQVECVATSPLFQVLLRLVEARHLFEELSEVLKLQIPAKPRILLEQQFHLIQFQYLPYSELLCEQKEGLQIEYLYRVLLVLERRIFLYIYLGQALLKWL